MPDASTFGVFVVASLVLVVVPGPAVFYIITRSVDQGRPAGFASVFGVGVGGLVHAAFAAVGLSAILASSATAFSVVKWLGVAYLVWLGIQRIFFAGDEEEMTETATPERLSRIFWQGVVVNVLNPKVALFFFALFPQFVHPDEGNVVVQTLALGVVFCVIGTALDCTWALLAGSAGGWLKGNARFLRRQRLVTGAIYLGLGITTAFAGNGKK